MTLIELQNVLGDRIDVAKNSGNLSDDERKKENETSEIIARLAKQMINNADVVLRNEKAVSEGKISADSRISQLIGK